RDYFHFVTTYVYLNVVEALYIFPPFSLSRLLRTMFLLVRIDGENRTVVIHSSWRMRNNWALIPPYGSAEELRSLVDQNVPLPDDTPADQVTGFITLAIGDNIFSCTSLQLSVNVYLFLLKLNLPKKLLGFKLNDDSSNNDTRSLARMPFMAPYRTVMDVDSGEVIWASEEKRKSWVLSTYTPSTIFIDALFL
ncbi:hypothetical protein PHET_11736, partial [Paragonimus heterotremus]